MCKVQQRAIDKVLVVSSLKKTADEPPVFQGGQDADAVMAQGKVPTPLAAKSRRLGWKMKGLKF